MRLPEDSLRRVLSLLTESKTNHYSGSPCIEYGGYRNEKGYGRTQINGRNWYIHRLIFVAVKKEALADDQVVMHLCDNRLCCNPDHLVAGSILQNNVDRATKGRGGRPMVKRWFLKPSEVAQIKLALRMGHSSRSICNRFGCTEHALREIRAGRTWAHVHPADKVVG